MAETESKIPETETKIPETETKIPEMLDELSSYLYGTLILALLAALMLLFHIGLSVFYHN